MIKKKCALLDTDFISKLHITRKDDQNRLIDRILELPGYRFVCHEQIATELGRHNTTAIDWLRRKIAEGMIQKFSDLDLITLLHSFYGKNAISMYLFYLSNACALFEIGFYGKYYALLEQNCELPDAVFAQKITLCDEMVGCDNNLGEIKTYLLQQVLQIQEEVQLYIFCSDDKNAREGLAYGGNIPCISALSSFYILKERLKMERDEAKLYFDSWMQFHRKNHQCYFKVHKDTKEMQFMKMEGYEVFNRIYDGTLTIMKNGNLKIRSGA